MEEWQKQQMREMTARWRAQSQTDGGGGEYEMGHVAAMESAADAVDEMIAGW